MNPTTENSASARISPDEVLALEIPDSLRNAEWSAVYPWVRNLSTDDLWRYRLVPVPGCNFSRDVSDTVENRDVLVENLYKMACYLNRIGRQEDPSEELRNFSVRDEEGSDRIMLARVTADGPDYGYKLHERGLDDQCTLESVQYWPWRFLGAQNGSYFGWNPSGADSGGCVLRVNGSISIPNWTAPPHNKQVVSIKVRYATAAQWRYSNWQQQYAIINWDSSKTSNGLTFHSRQFQDGYIWSDNRCGYVSGQQVHTVDISPHWIASGTVGGSLAQSFLRAPNNNSFSWFTSEETNDSGNGLPRTVHIYVNIPNESVNYTYYHPPINSTWWNCQLKPQITPFFLLWRKGGQGNDCGLSSTTGYYPITMQMGRGWNGTNPWPNSAGNPPDHWRHSYRRYLSPQALPPYSPIVCIKDLQNPGQRIYNECTGYFFSMTSYLQSSGKEPWYGETSKIWCRIRWFSKYYDGTNCIEYGEDEQGQPVNDHFESYWLGSPTYASMGTYISYDLQQINPVCD